MCVAPSCVFRVHMDSTIVNWTKPSVAPDRVLCVNPTATGGTIISEICLGGSTLEYVLLKEIM